MAAMSPYAFYEGFVYEDFSDWKDEPESIRKAFHVAVSAFHLADHYCRYHQIRSPTFQKLYGKDAIRDEGLNKFPRGAQESAAIIRSHPRYGNCLQAPIYAIPLLDFIRRIY